MSNAVRLLVRPQGKGAIQAGHPWVMAQSIVMPAENIAVGTEVALTLPDGRVIAKGLANLASRIAVRSYTTSSDSNLDLSLFQHRIDQALALRDSSYFDAARSALRLVFSEGDQLSGLIVDRFGDYLVVQQTAAALHPFMPELIDHLEARIRPSGVLWLVDAATAKLEGISPVQKWVRGSQPTNPVEIEENGIKFEIDLDVSQKTGYYLDQRENRTAAARWISNGSRVLDVCTYIGGFALTIAKLKSDCQVVGIDASRKAIETATRHADVNGLTNVRFEVGDFLEVLEAKSQSGETFDAIVLDPPKMAGSRDSIERALRAYHRVNTLAMRLLSPGGILVTCSCSGRVLRDDFWRMLRGVAKQTRRSLQILEQRGAAPDHPISSTCPESDYLKCFICRVNS